MVKIGRNEMCKICILGWYGTETLGDRAILDGIFQIFDKAFGKFDAYIGSLYPFFTERTFMEDGMIYKQNAPDMNYIIFDSKSGADLKKYICDSDFVIMGGGPLMDINEMALIRKGFQIARKHQIPTGLFGCGIGPLHNELYMYYTAQILELTDIGIFRDSESRKYAEMVCRNKKFYTCADPAVISVLTFRDKNDYPADGLDEKNILVNYRKITSEYGSNDTYIHDFILGLTKKISEQYQKVILLPNHTFFIGGDDRVYLNTISEELNISNVYVQNEPLNLYQLYRLIQNTGRCVGMRYHSVLMQTILSGNNIILDYTEPNVGKISGFIKELDNPEFYNERYYNFSDEKGMDMEACLHTLERGERYFYKSSNLFLEEYLTIIFDICKQL